MTNTNPKTNDKIVFREEGDEAFLFDADSGAIKILNETGMFIWKLCDGRHSKDEILDMVLEEFDAPSREDAEGDLQKFLQSLKGCNFIDVKS